MAGGQSCRDVRGVFEMQPAVWNFAYAGKGYTYFYEDICVSFGAITKEVRQPIWLSNVVTINLTCRFAAS